MMNIEIEIQEIKTQLHKVKQKVQDLRRYL